MQRVESKLDWSVAQSWILAESHALPGNSGQILLPPSVMLEFLSQEVSFVTDISCHRSCCPQCHMLAYRQVYVRVFPKAPAVCEQTGGALLGLNPTQT